MKHNSTPNADSAQARHVDEHERKPQFNINEPLTIIEGDCRERLITLPDECIQCCVTSVPYFSLRDYGTPGQIGLESSPEAYIETLVNVFCLVRRVLKDNGSVWLVIGDSYARAGGTDHTVSSTAKVGNTQKTIAYRGNRSAKVPPGFKQKDLFGLPWRVALALQSDGWWLRQDIVWDKPNAAPESVRDRFTRCHEYIFLLTKSQHYFFDHEAIREEAKTGGVRNRRSVWSVPVNYRKTGGHPAAFPPALIEPCILAGSGLGDIVLDPFSGSGTTAEVALKHGRRAVMIDVNSDYVSQMKRTLPPLGSAH